MTLAGSCTASCLRHGPSAADSSRPRGRGDGLGQQHTAGLTEPPPTRSSVSARWSADRSTPAPGRAPAAHGEHIARELGLHLEQSVAARRAPSARLGVSAPARRRLRGGGARPQTVRLPEPTPLVRQANPQVAPAGRPIMIESIGTGRTVAPASGDGHLAHDGVAVVAPLLGQKTGHHLYFGVYYDGHTMIPRRAWPREHGSASSRAQMQAQPCLQSKGSAEAAEPV